MPRGQVKSEYDRRILDSETVDLIFEAHFCLAMTVEQAAHYAGVDKMTVSKYWNQARLLPLNPRHRGHRPRMTRDQFPDGYVSAAHVSRELKVGRQYITKLFKDRKLDGYREAGHLWVSEQSLEREMKQRELSS